MRTGALIAIIILIIVFLGGGYWYQQHSLRQDQQEALTARQEAYQTNLVAFETFLNQFLQNVSARVGAYKQGKQVLVSLVQPDNLRSSEYVAENKALGDETIAALQTQMNEIMGLFEQANADFASLIAAFPPDQQDELSARWNEEIEKQTALYVAYFEQEQAALGAYYDLLSLYADKRDAMSIDVDTGRVMFTDPLDQTLERDIKARITAAQNAQKALAAQKQDAAPAAE